MASQKAALLRGLGWVFDGFCACVLRVQVCSSPRNECRSAVRIKVLDVLSFVLLINRQFYEVCVQDERLGCGLEVGLALGSTPIWTLYMLQQSWLLFGVLLAPLYGMLSADFILLCELNGLFILWFLLRPALGLEAAKKLGRYLPSWSSDLGLTQNPEVSKNNLV